MFIIKNRVNGEYDTRGLYGSMNTFDRSSWNTLGQAKNHVAQKVTGYWYSLQYIDWYIDADYIEVNESGTLNVYPVVEHLREYFAHHPYRAEKLTPDQREKLGLK